MLEYWLHRIVFHFEPEDGWGARLHYIIHGVHHDHPNDPLRLVMPPAVSVPLALLFFALFYVVFGPNLAPGVTAGFLAGYLVYDMTHFYMHHGQPRNRVAKFLRERHMRHHFQDDTRGFGVSAPYWDDVFRTAPRSRRAAQREPAQQATAERRDRAISRNQRRFARPRPQVRPQPCLDSGTTFRRQSRPTVGKEVTPWPPRTSTGSF